MTSPTRSAFGPSSSTGSASQNVGDRSQSDGLVAAFDGAGAIRGKQSVASATFGHWKTQTFIADLRCDGLTAPFEIDAPTDRRIFET
jgi:hypothetical protein